MILDKLQNAHLYMGLGGNIQKALRCLQQADFAAMQDGRYEIDGDALIAVARTYETKPVPDCRMESHRKYIDIQYVAAGAERMGYANVETLPVKTGYDADADVMYYDGTGELFGCAKGTFAIFMPGDAHMPEAALDEPR